mmetsp:Transcript_3486/g.6548  ORF Transcript_3486/g.6548 Transcript_3486/m.6548 type:complete len:338 (-) Transcript_3486:547-1560(-)|eukprot:CAMPEP_0184687308 /NCGR_PEP_ID=MMETSP0312-20130426/25911_1 /TAXON_ID=31354 /ORGANISM="Compsopogon coeruleus, Strain SAG 36.94" /LENGTH=337 /DNA_ID=CAMNT_0027143297 /DNA_START=335 /DNA_END=1348 /DNA_ORIENTATION=-
MFRRAAFDIGSNQHKLVIADVDGNRVKRILFSMQEQVLLQQGFLSSGGDSIPLQTLDRSMDVLRRFKGICSSEFSVPVECMSGIGTAVFRKARNGAEYLNQVRRELGIRLSLASQDEEARIGFLTAVALHGGDSDTIASWDAGGGSFQLADSNMNYFLGPCGDSDVCETLVSRIRRARFEPGSSVNPVSLDEVNAVIEDIRARISQQLTLGKPPQWLANKQVVSFGFLTSAFRICTDVAGNPRFEPAQLRRELQRLVGKNDEQIQSELNATSPHPRQDPYPEVGMALPKIALVLSVMLALKIDRLQYYETNGSCLGLLLHEVLWAPPVGASIDENRH